MGDNRLYNRRKELQLTLEEVGDIVGVSKSTVRKWETGYIENMKRDKIALLAKALQTTPLFIMGIEENKIIQAVHPLVAKYESLDERGKHTVDAILNVEYDRCTKPYIGAMAAHNDDASPEQNELMRQDLEEL